MRVTAHKEQCVGAGLCVLSAPEVFDQNPDDGLVEVRADQPAAEHADAVREAVALCPARAIAIG